MADESQHLDQELEALLAKKEDGLKSSGASQSNLNDFSAPYFFNSRVLSTYKGSLPKPVAKLIAGIRLRRGLFVLALVSVIVLAFASLQPSLRPTIPDLPIFKPFSQQQTTCPDPYTLPGFFLHDPWGGKTAQWLPYTRNTYTATDGIDISRMPRTRSGRKSVPDSVKEALPSLVSKLNSVADRGNDPDLQFLRGKTILLLGCSIDRYFLEGFCASQKGKFKNPADGWHGIFSCTIPIQLWFNYGAMPGPLGKGDTGDPHDFEGRIRDYWRPKADAVGDWRHSYDLIIFASGTWDILETRIRLYKKAKDEHKRFDDAAMTFEELAWHRKRLREIKDFLKDEFPGVPSLYRTPTFFYKKDIPSHNYYLGGVTKLSEIDFLNESVLRMTESAKSLALYEDFEIFRWSEKLIGHNYYADTMHIHGDSNAQRLYADMMLYYLKYYTSTTPSHCLPSETDKKLSN